MKKKLGVLVIVLVVLEIQLALGAFYGGVALIAAPDGSMLGLRLELLEGSPFRDFLVPGIVLFVCNGLIPVVVAVAALRRRAWARLGHLAVGCLLVGWIGVELVVVGWNALAAIYGVYGVVVAALALLHLHRSRAVGESAVRSPHGPAAARPA